MDDRPLVEMTNEELNLIAGRRIGKIGDAAHRILRERLHLIHVEQLVLPVKRKWFTQIKDGTKTEEYRLVNDYWSKRLVNKTFGKVVITLGYPKRDDISRRIELPWRGYYKRTIISEEWNNISQEVFAIRLT